MLLVVDNGSVYTKNLTDLLEQRDILFQRRPPQLLDFGTLGTYDSVILSGRRRNEKIINHVNSRIVIHCIKNSTKLLGICYGAEILSLAMGGTIRRAASPQKGHQTVKIFRENPLARNSLDVFESHAYEISKIPKSLVSIAGSGNCKYEMIQYEKKPVFGTQFHPEMSHDGRNLIERFCLL